MPRVAADPDDLLALALDAARAAGELVATMRDSGVDIADTKESETDIVTVADRAAERLIRETIQRARPADGFHGEEEADRVGRSGVRWVVDPIDGTVNYAHDLPHYAVSIAAEVDGRTIAAVVRNPATGVEYTAVQGRGAWRDGTPLRVATPSDWSRAVVATGFSYAAQVRAGQAQNLTRLLPAVADIRRFGSCALDLCAVAEGTLDGYVEDDIGGEWDFAAGRLIAAEAGASVEVIAGAGTSVPGYLVIAAAADSFGAFRSLVEECGYLTR